jgi:hypothetical protein
VLIIAQKTFLALYESVYDDDEIFASLLTAIFDSKVDSRNP